MGNMVIHCLSDSEMRSIALKDWKQWETASMFNLIKNRTIKQTRYKVLISEFKMC